MVPHVRDADRAGLASKRVPPPEERRFEEMPGRSEPM